MIRQWLSKGGFEAKCGVGMSDILGIAVPRRSLIMSYVNTRQYLPRKVGFTNQESSNKFYSTNAPIRSEVLPRKLEAIVNTLDLMLPHLQHLKSIDSRHLSWSNADIQIVFKTILRASSNVDMVKMDDVEDSVMEFIEASNMNDEIATILAIFYENTQDPFCFNLLRRHEMHCGKLYEAYFAVVSGLQQWAPKQKSHISNGTLELLVINLLRNNYMGPAYSILRASKTHKYNITSRIWRFYIQKLVDNCPYVSPEILRWTWNEVILNDGATFVNNGTLVKLSESLLVTNEISPGLLSSINRYYVKKNEHLSPLLSTRMLLAHYNSLAHKGHKAAWFAILEDLKDNSKELFKSGYKLKPEDFPIVVRMLQHPNYKNMDKVFSSVLNNSVYKKKKHNISFRFKRGEKYNGSPDDFFFLTTPYPFLNTLFLNTYLLSLIEGCRKEVDGKLTSIQPEKAQALIDSVNLLLEEFNVNLNDNTFTYLLEIAVLSALPHVISSVLSSASSYLQANNTDVKIKPLTCLNIVRVLTNNSQISHTLKEKLIIMLQHLNPSIKVKLKNTTEQSHS